VTSYGPWDPATPSEALALFGDCGVPWWIAGGYALELFAGRSWRTHGDLDVLMLHRDQLVVQDVLAGWEWWAADPPGTLRRWEPGEVLPPSVQDVWCRPGADLPWRIQVMLGSSLPASSVVVAGIPCLGPEVQLSHKALSPRPKDEVDFFAVVGLLDGSQRRWLRDAVRRSCGDSHAWLGFLG